MTHKFILLTCKSNGFEDTITSFIFKIFNFYFYFVCVIVLAPSMSVDHMCVEPVEARIEYQVPWDWSYR